MEEFWSLTPRETAAVFDAWEWRREDERQARLVTAWWTAALGRAKKLPPLKTLLAPPPREKTEDERAEEIAKAKADFEYLVDRMGGHG